MQRCSEKAFAMCPTRHLCGTREEATFSEHSECAAFNKAVDDKPMTNADRIRAMTDEELATFLADDNRVCPPVHQNCSRHVHDCAGCHLWWLQQAAKEDV